MSGARKHSSFIGMLDTLRFRDDGSMAWGHMERVGESLFVCDLLDSDGDAIETFVCDVPYSRTVTL